MPWLDGRGLIDLLFAALSNGLCIQSELRRPPPLPDWLLSLTKNKEFQSKNRKYLQWNYHLIVNWSLNSRCSRLIIQTESAAQSTMKNLSFFHIFFLGEKFCLEDFIVECLVHGFYISLFLPYGNIQKNYVDIRR